MNITVDSRMFYVAGIGTCTQNLIPFLAKESSITLLFNTNDIKSHFSSSNINIVKTYSPIYSIKEQLELPLKIPKCDIFWAPHYNAPLLPIRAKKKIVTIHDVFHLAHFEKLNLKQKLYAKIVLNSVVRLYDKIITDSDFSKSEIIKYTNINKDKVTVIPVATDRKTFRFINDKTLLNEIKIKYNFPDKFILFVGSFKPHKNIKNLLLAFSKLPISVSNSFNIVIVGKKEGFITGDRESLNLINHDDFLKKKVLFTEHVSTNDLAMIYNLASVLVFPSLYEGFGLPPLEAMACGCPVVVSNVASLPEVCGDAAYYVDPYSVESIAEGMQKVLTDENLRQDLIEKGHERVKLFSWEKSAQEYLKVIKEVMEEKDTK